MCQPHVYSLVNDSAWALGSPTMSTHGRVVTRVLSPARAAMRDRLIDATVELATSGGYDAVTIRAVAAHAGVSVPTVYQHASSRDQLLAEALLALGQRSTDDLRDRPPKGKTPAERISSVFQRIMRAAHDNPLLYQALYRGWVVSATEIANVDGAPGFGPERAAWIGEALRAGSTGRHSEEDLQSATRILSCLFLGALIEVASGRDLDAVRTIVDEAAHRLLP